jgi:hypothetical protein
MALRVRGRDDVGAPGHDLLPRRERSRSSPGKVNNRRPWKKIAAVAGGLVLVVCLGLTFQVMPGLDGVPPITPHFMANRRITISSASSLLHQQKSSVNSAQQNVSSPPGSPPNAPPPPLKLTFPFPDAKYRIHKTVINDTAPACKDSGICDGKYDCGTDGLGCIRDAETRRKHVQDAARWSWAGYRSVAPETPHSPGCIP